MRDEGPDGVTFLGRVSEADKRSELASAGVMVAPNLGGESFGIILTEAMAAGCAVVASDLAAFRAVAGEAGVMVEPGNPGVLAAAIVSLLGNIPAMSAAADAGRTVVEQYDWSRVSEAYLAAYRDAVEAAD